MARHCAGIKASGAVSDPPGLTPYHNLGQCHGVRPGGSDTYVAASPPSTGSRRSRMALRRGGLVIFLLVRSVT